MDLSKVSKGGQIFAAGGIVYFIASLLPWYTLDVGADARALGFEDVSFNAWGDLGFLWGALWALLLIAGAVTLILPAFGVSAPKFPAAAYLGVAGLASFFTLLKLLIGEEVVDTGFGIIVAVIAALAALFGAFTMFKDAGGNLSDLKDMNKLKSQFGGGSSAPPPPPGMPPPPPPR